MCLAMWKRCSLSLRKLSDSSPDLPPSLPQAGQSRANQFCGQQSGVLLIGLIVSDLEILLILPGCSSAPHPKQGWLSLEPVQGSSLDCSQEPFSEQAQVRHSCWFALSVTDPQGLPLHWERKLQ